MATMGILPNMKLPKNRRSMAPQQLETWESVERTMSTLELTTTALNNGNYDGLLLLNLTLLGSSLPNYGHFLEDAYKGQLDRAFAIFRNACRDDRLNQHCRVNLLALIEKRANNWQKSEVQEQYYRNIIPSPEAEAQTQPIRVDPFQGTHPAIPSAMLSPTLPLLGPGEQIKSSGRFPQPTKISGKGYYKDEVVINNADSGKVMGIKGRRVHMIEELSETIISFQRVTPGVKERLVQITGPNEVRINEAIHLMGDTIRRNASPVPFRVDQPDLGSSSSVNSSASEESARVQTGYPQSNHRLQHSFSTNDASPEYKHTVTVGPHTIKLTGTNYQLVSDSKLVLERYFGERKLGSQVDDLFPNDYVDEQFAAEEVQPIEVKQSVIRQPLFPEAPRAVFEQVEASGRPADLSARNRRAFFGQTNMEKEKVSHVLAPKNHLRYSREMMLNLANSKLCVEEPQDWAVVCPSALIKVYPLCAHLAPQDLDQYHKQIKRTVSDPRVDSAPPSVPRPDRDAPSYDLPKPSTSSPKLKRRVSFDLQSRPLLVEEALQGMSPLGRQFATPSNKPFNRTVDDEHCTNMERPSHSLSITPSLEHRRSRPITPANEPSLTQFEDCEASPLPVTTIPFRPAFKFAKKASLPEMAPEAATGTPVPFVRSQSTPSPAASFPESSLDIPSESMQTKQTKSFRPQLTNPKLGYLLSTNANNPFP